MPNLGMGELLVIIVIGLLVFGPNRLPEIARNVGKAWRVFQQETGKARSVFKEAFDEVDKVKSQVTDIGVIDAPDAPAAAPAAPAAENAEAPPPTTRPEPSAEAVAAAAVVEPAAEREYEDT